MKIDVLVFEIGSTTTVVNAFDGIDTNNIKFLGQGQANTSVLLGDVTIGLNEAINDLTNKLNVKDLDAKEIFATSSAAGGLRMTVHGLVHDMTVKAAQNAALGAGANLKFITSGKITNFDVAKISDIRPNIILIAGGVDYGERETALYNSEVIASLKLNIPVIYAGNCAIQDEVRKIFKDNGQEEYLSITDNVYPRIDELNVLKTRTIIQDVFEKHIITAVGMEKVRTIVNDRIIPTPGAVMQAAIMLKEKLNDLIVFDVGGATTDLHSVTDGNIEVSKLLVSPEPRAKRTVEGDLGLFVNKDKIIEKIGLEQLSKDLKITRSNLNELIENYQAIPSDKQVPLVERLTLEALKIALDRHAGSYRNLYGASGRMKIAEGKDLTNVKYIIGTGGALTRLPNRKLLLRQLIERGDPLKLVPPKDVDILIDNDYIMASIGVLSLKHPESSLKLLLDSFNKGD